jgi:hypothetical protein
MFAWLTLRCRTPLFLAFDLRLDSTAQVAQELLQEYLVLLPQILHETPSKNMTPWAKAAFRKRYSGVSFLVRIPFFASLAQHRPIWP